jgi:hypothetical protein
LGISIELWIIQIANPKSKLAKVGFVINSDEFNKFNLSNQEYRMFVFIGKARQARVIQKRIKIYEF